MGRKGKLESAADIIRNLPEGEESLREANWIPFFVESQSYSGKIATRDNWRELVRAHGGDSQKVRGFKMFNGEAGAMPEFGDFPEHSKKPTLGAWAKQNRLSLRV